jgi:hypothetical protein
MRCQLLQERTRCSRVIVAAPEPAITVFRFRVFRFRLRSMIEGLFSNSHRRPRRILGTLAQ